MASKVVVSDRAILKINTTVSYIENVCNNRTYAKRLYEAIEDCILGLETKEGLHIKDQAVSSLLGKDVYRIKLGKYRLLYLIDAEKSTVLVFSFLHEAQDFEAIVLSDLANAS